MEEPTWYQRPLLPPDVVQVHLEVGLVPKADHSQFWWSVRDPTDGTLLAGGSLPHRSLNRIRECAHEALDAALDKAHELTSPF